MQNHAIPWNTMQYRATPCNTMQSHAIPCNTMQYHAKPCKTMKYHAIPCNTMQYHAIPCNTMQYYAIQCNTTQYHASLITVDGAYLCPVGSILAIFYIFACQIGAWVFDICFNGGIIWIMGDPKKFTEVQQFFFSRIVHALCKRFNFPWTRKMVSDAEPWHHL